MCFIPVLFSHRVYQWPHTDDDDGIPDFSETDYQVVRHAFLKVTFIAMLVLCIILFMNFVLKDVLC